MSSLWIVLTGLLVIHQQLRPDFRWSHPCMVAFSGVRPGDASSLIFAPPEQLRLVSEGGVLLAQGGRGQVEPSPAFFRGRNLLTWSWVPEAEYPMEEQPCQRRANGSVFVTRVRWQEPSGSPTSGLKPQIVVLGDSITKGVRPGVTAEETFAAVLQRRLQQQGLSYEVINRGIGGERTDQAFKRLARDVTALEPQLVTVMYGTNDSYVDQGRHESRISADQFESGLRRIATELEGRGIRVVLMTEPAWGKAAGLNGTGEHPNERLSVYMERTRSVAQELKLPLVDHFQIWNTAAAGGADIGAWTTDQCHPNPVGHVKLAEAMLPVVSSALAKK